MERTCGPEEWACKSKSGQCIPNAWVCDDHEDCDDKSDEEVCSKFKKIKFDQCLKHTYLKRYMKNVS